MDSSESARPIDRLFTMLLVKYGTRWLNQWGEGTIELVKRDWEQELSGISWGAIKYAMDHLPSDRPPATAAAFRALANNRPQYFQALPPPKADPERVKEILGRLSESQNPALRRWAQKLKEKK